MDLWRVHAGWPGTNSLDTPIYPARTTTTTTPSIHLSVFLVISLGKHAWLYQPSGLQMSHRMCHGFALGLHNLVILAIGSNLATRLPSGSQFVQLRWLVSHNWLGLSFISSRSLQCVVQYAGTGSLERSSEPLELRKRPGPVDCWHTLFACASNQSSSTR